MAFSRRTACVIVAAAAALTATLVAVTRSGRADPAGSPAGIGGSAGVAAATARVKAVAAGLAHSCALTTSGGVKCWGGDYGWTPVTIPGLSRGVVAISASLGHSCALTDDGSVTCWGANGNGQLGDGTRHIRLTPVDVVGFAPLILPTHTPGARNPAVTQATLSKTVCRAGWTTTIRPPMSYTNALKRKQLARFHYADRNPAHYQEDHLISLELGGAPRSTKNLWPEPWPQAHEADRRENAWHRKLCNGTLTLQQAQKLELAYKRQFG